MVYLNWVLLKDTRIMIRRQSEKQLHLSSSEGSTSQYSSDIKTQMIESDMVSHMERDDQFKDSVHSQRCFSVLDLHMSVLSAAAATGDNLRGTDRRKTNEDNTRLCRSFQNSLIN
jgi:hypothetical protein